MLPASSVPQTVREHKWIIALLLVFVSVQCFSFFAEGDIWWDAAVYIGMGKYIYSLGNAGLWEPVRPLLWPLLLGFFWKLGLDPLFWGHIILLLMGAGCIFLTYLIGLYFFDKKRGFFAALLLSFFPTFFLYASVLQTEIPSTFFLLAGLFFFIRERYSFAMLLFSIAFLTRFFVAFLFVPICLYFLYLRFSSRISWKDFIVSSLFFVIPLSVYLLSNFFLYDDILFPFITQAYMTTYTGWIFHQSWNYYFIMLFKENILIFFAVLGLLSLCLKTKNLFSEKQFFLLFFVAGALPFFVEAHKELRILIPLLPFVCIFIADGLFLFLERIKYKKTALFFIISIWLFFTIPQLHFNNYDDHLDFFSAALENSSVIEEVWISNPAFLASNDLKAAVLLYYPLYNSEKIEELRHGLSSAQLVLLNTCDLIPCPPTDSACPEAHAAFLLLLQQEFEIKLQSSFGDCAYFIFSRN